jgi:hypothetical protein
MSHPNIGVLMPSCRPTLTAEAFDGLRNFPQGVAFVVLIAQKFTADDWSKVIADHDPGVPVLLHWQPNGTPVYDIEPIETTNWPTLAQLVHDGDYGVVSGNFARSRKLMHRSWPPRQPEFVRQPFTNMSGGQAVPKRLVPVLSGEVADGMGLAPWYFDDVQVGLTAYLMGEQPVRWRGSLALHKILSPNGLNGPSGLFSRIEVRHRLPDPQWVTVHETPEGSNYDYLMPRPADITAAAHERHKARKEKR